MSRNERPKWKALRATYVKTLVEKESTDTLGARRYQASMLFRCSFGGKLPYWVVSSAVIEESPKHYRKLVPIAPGMPNLLIYETYLFRANSSGKILEWMELAGSMRMTLRASDAFENAGYRTINEPKLSIPEWATHYGDWRAP